jgi:hypothetical protein
LRDAHDITMAESRLMAIRRRLSNMLRLTLLAALALLAHGVYHVPLRRIETTLSTFQHPPSSILAGPDGYAIPLTNFLDAQARGISLG